ncbi:alpha/beta fold hydrolase [Arsenicicoccus dermatophilus]|uniref:alpha/beta fold hydrolase n=1 Tax=Arsenicicoccus dermatophilus TaxID=1076331 RepID=UPI001F4CBD35|nr:alpha/beta hydrolase [Arsenicicoccus dermatophilus]MCH8612287.1 alpha/beta hydrolase [Arsenicicoccus dermatophilus]
MAATLVLVHGTRMSSQFWRDYPALLPGVRIVTPDLPGHGARVGEEFTWDSALATIDDAVQDTSGPVVLAGHSLGGYVAMAWAARHPRRLAGLALVGSCAIPRGPGLLAYQGFARLVPVVGPARVARVANALITRLASGRDLTGIVDDGEAYAALPTAWAAVTAHARPELLGEVTCPLLLLNGSRDQLRLHARAFARAAVCAAEVRVVTVAGATHVLPLTHAPRCAAELQTLLDRAGDR